MWFKQVVCHRLALCPASNHLSVECQKSRPRRPFAFPRPSFCMQPIIPISSPTVPLARDYLHHCKPKDLNSSLPDQKKTANQIEYGLMCRRVAGTVSFWMLFRGCVVQERKAIVGPTPWEFQNHPPFPSMPGAERLGPVSCFRCCFRCIIQSSWRNLAPAPSPHCRSGRLPLAPEDGPPCPLGDRGSNEQRYRDRDGFRSPRHGVGRRR